MKTGKGKFEGKEVTFIGLDSITKDQEKIIYQFLGKSIYPHSKYYILDIQKSVTDSLRDAMIRDVYNSPSLLAEIVAASNIDEMVDIWQANEFEFDA